MASYTREQFIAEYEKQMKKRGLEVPAEKTARQQFIEEYTELYNQRKKQQGQAYTAPVSVEQTVNVPQEVPQSNVTSGRNRYTDNDLKIINSQISAFNDIKGKNAEEREQLNKLLIKKDEAEKYLKKGLYDDDLSLTDRLTLTGQSIAEGYNAAPDVLADTAAQAFKDWDKNRMTREYNLTKAELDSVNKQINTLQYKIKNGFSNQVDTSQLEKLLNEQARLQGIINEKYTTPMDINGASMQKMQKAMQKQQKATEGMSDTAEFYWNVGTSIVDNASLMPLAVLPGGQAAITALMGVKAAAQKAVEVGESGRSAGEALFRGAASGLIEAATEKVPLEELVKMAKGPVGKSLIKNILKQAGTEGTEEVISYIANNIVDIAAKDPNAQWSFTDAFMSFLGGAISGGIMGGGASLLGRQNAAQMQQDVTQSPQNATEMPQNAMEMPQNAAQMQQGVIPPVENDNSILQSTAKTDERAELEKAVKQAAGIDTRTEVEKTVQEQQERVETVAQLVKDKIAPAEELDKALNRANEKITEAENRQANLDYQKLDAESGAARTEAINSGKGKTVEDIERFAAKRGFKVKYYSADADSVGNGFINGDTIYINVQDSNVMYKTAIHETIHGLRSGNSAEYAKLYNEIMGYSEQYKYLNDIADSVMNAYTDPDSIAYQSILTDGQIDADKLSEEVLCKLCEEVIKDPEGFIINVDGNRGLLGTVADLLRKIKNSLAITLTNSEKAKLDNAVMAIERYLRNEGDEIGKRFSYGGMRANNAHDNFLRAEQLAELGTDNETIRRETGWFKGADSKWRFEIDDSKMQVDTVGRLHRNPDIRKNMQLFEDVYINGDTSKLEELQISNKNLKGVKLTPQRLGDMISHPDLFKHYPELADVGVEFKDLPAGHEGGFVKKEGKIVLNKSLRTDERRLKRTLIHEIQHWIQYKEGFAGGASTKYWTGREGNNGKTAKELYLNTAGEQESRDVEKRMNYTAEQRRAEAPFTGDENTVFVKNAGYSAHISNTAEQEINKALADKNYRQEIKLRDFTPAILVEHGARDLPMLMKASHLRENIFTAQEAAANGLRVNAGVNYHGLGKSLFMQVIDSLDNPQRVYRGTKNADNTSRGENYFLIISTIKDSDGNSINVPVYIEQTGNYNNVFIDTNKIATVFGRKDINEYVKRETFKGNLVQVKRKSSLSIKGLSPIESALDKTTSVNNISQTSENDNGNILSENHKEKQLAIINRTNPMGDSYHLGIRSVDDIKTFAEAMEDDESFVYGDFEIEDAQKALERGAVTVYSSYPITNGVFVSTSKNMAKDYAGGGRVYSKTVPLEDVAWINGDEGQFAKVDTRYSSKTSAESGSVDISDDLKGLTIRERIDARANSGVTAKSRNVQTKAENTLIKTISNAFGVKYADKQGVIKEMVKDITAQVKANGTVKAADIDKLVDTAFEKGVISENQLVKQYPNLKKELRESRFKYQPGEVFQNVRNNYFGKLLFAKDGTDVDILYKEYSDKYPEIFPEDIIYPDAQIVRFADVYDSLAENEQSLASYYGEQSENMKSLIKEDLQYAVDRYIAEINDVSAYETSKRISDAERQIRQNSKTPLTKEEYKAAQDKAYKAQKTLDKLTKDILLTDEENKLVDTLLAGGAPELVSGKNRDKILAVYTAKKAVQDAQAPIKQYKADIRSKRQEIADSVLTTFRSWKDKKIGLGYSTETMERNIRDIVPDSDEAFRIIDTYITPVHQAEADAVRLKNRMRERVRALNIDTSTKKEHLYNVSLFGESGTVNLSVNESGLVQLFGEKKITEQQLKDCGADVVKIKNAVSEFRKIYNELYDMADDALVRNGYAPLGKIEDYFPHFLEESDTVLSKLAKRAGFEVQTNKLPTSIAGITETFKPGKKWFANALTRTGDTTVFDAVNGFDQYIEGVSGIIYQTDNIQNLRELENRMRYLAGDKGLREQLDAIDADDSLSVEDKQDKKDRLYKEQKNFNLSNFVTYLRDYTNTIAGKKQIQDRGIEHDLGRGIYTMSKALEGRIASNMIGANIGSALTNFIPIAQAYGEIKTKHMLQAMNDTMHAMYGKDNSFEYESDFLTNRFGSDKLVYTWAQNISNKTGVLMTAIDRFTSNVITRARYYQNIENGMERTLALMDADSFAANVLADRSKGAQPLVFERRNPLVKAVTMFQVEQNNQFRYLLKDFPRGLRGKAKEVILVALLKYAVASFLYNQLYEKLIGRRPAFDPIDICLGMYNDTSDAVKGNIQPSEAMKNISSDILEEVPFVSGLAGGGRIPISSAMPDIAQLLKLVDGNVSGDKKKQIAWNELKKPLFYIVPTTAGGQLKKGAETYELFAKNKGVEYSIDNDGNKKVKFAAQPTVGNVVRSAAFGKWSLPEAREYIDAGNNGLTKDETTAFNALVDSGMGYLDVKKMLEDRKSADTDGNGYYTTEEAKAYLDKTGYTREQKAILFACMCPSVKNNPYR